jgi:hypothetical protein
VPQTLSVRNMATTSLLRNKKTSDTDRIILPSLKWGGAARLIASGQTRPPPVVWAESLGPTEPHGAFQ